MSWQPTHTIDEFITYVHPELHPGTAVKLLSKGFLKGPSLITTIQGGVYAIPNDQLKEIKPMSNAAELSHPGEISGDRVHFKLLPRHLAKDAYKELLEECFGIKRGEYSVIEDLKIICRPSQFARFIILRHTKYAGANDVTNEISGLDLKLVSPAKPKNLIDCSTRTNTAVGEVAA